MRLRLALDPGNELGELAGVLGLIVHAAEQEILEGDVLARLERIAFQRRHEIVEMPVRGFGHDLGAEILIGRVKRDGKEGEAAVAEFAQARLDAAGRNGNAAGGEIHPLVVVQHLKCAGGFAQVEQRLAHAHEDEVADNGVVDAVVAEPHTGHENLAQDFPGGHVADKAHRARAAKRAAHRAADLRRHALGDPDGTVLPCSGE